MLCNIIINDLLFFPSKIFDNRENDFLAFAVEFDNRYRKSIADLECFGKILDRRLR